VTKALEMVGREIEAGEAVAEALRDKPYYDGSGGGVTLSGGEPAMQPEFLYALAALFRKENIHTALETSGFCDYKILETVLPYIDLFLFDYKETDPGRHQEYTGVLNTPILENLSRLCRAGARVILRCPIIPGLNDRDDHFRGIAELAAKYPAIEGVELLPYHKLAAAKTGRLGLNAHTIYPQVSGEITAVWSEAVSAYGARVI
jgi:pyruvate formate lyase activating enzyme